MADNLFILELKREEIDQEVVDHVSRHVQRDTENAAGNDATDSKNKEGLNPERNIQREALQDVPASGNSKLRVPSAALSKAGLAFLS